MNQYLKYNSSLQKCLTLIIFNFTFYISASSQDPQFTQSFGAMTYNNPAFAESDTMGTVFLTHRNQWPKLSGTYQTTVFGWQQYIGSLNSYAGFHYMCDKAGAITTQRYTLNYAQNIKIKKLLLRPSIEGVFFQKEIDRNQLSFGNQIDSLHGFTNSTIDNYGGSVSNIDYNLGILLNRYNFTLGISIHHLTQPNESLLSGNSPLPMKFGIQLGYCLQIGLHNNMLNLEPYLMYYSQGRFQLFQFGINTIYRKMIIGFSKRYKDCFSGLIGFRHQKYIISYSYDYTISTLTNKATGGSHEVSAAYRFWKRHANKKYIQIKSAFF